MQMPREYDQKQVENELKNLIGEVNSFICPVGMITAFAGAYAPTGWLLCVGQAVGRSEYGRLFSVIGTTYGAGDSSTTFNIPDLRARVPIALDNMGGTSADRIVATKADIIASAIGISPASGIINDGFPYFTMNYIVKY